jgi:hypothetical protein
MFHQNRHRLFPQAKRPPFASFPSTIMSKPMERPRLYRRAILAGGGLAAVGLAVIFDPRAPKPSKPGSSTPQVPLTKTTVIMGDLTDTEVPDLTAVQREIDVVAGNAAQGDRLAVLALSATGPTAIPTTKTLFDQTRPDDGKNASDLYQNRAMLQRNYHEIWVDRLATLTEDKIRPLAGKDAQQTPLMATLRQLGRDRLLNAAGGNTLLIFSDMIEYRPNTDKRPGLSMYGSFPDFRKLHATGAAEVQVDGLFADTDVAVFLFQPPKSRPAQANPRHGQFWKDFFDCAGAKTISTYRL